MSTFLDHVNVGDSVVCGNVEAYSCKLTGLDKQLSKSLDEEFQQDTRASELAKSPVGPLAEASSRKTLVYLILALSESYPDYDFSQLRARHFRKEPSPSSVEPVIDSHMLQVSKVWDQNPRYGSGKFLDALWASIDEACDLGTCDVYSYRADGENEEYPFSEPSAIWSFSYFFYNRRLKRIVHFSCRSFSSKAAHRSRTPGDSSTPGASLTTGEKQDTRATPGESDSEIVGGMDDMS